MTTIPPGSGSGRPDPRFDEGWIDVDIQEEFPGLRLFSVTQTTWPGRSPRELRERLHMLSNRFNGAAAVTLRRRPIPHAYRVFFRHIGLDPDTTRTPVEEAAVERLMRGGYAAKGRLEASLLLAVVETGVPVWALDDERVDGPLGIRPAQEGERLGDDEESPDVPEGRLVVADGTGPVAVLFGDIAPDRRPSRATQRARIFTIQVAGVPSIHIEEALWTVSSALTT